MKNILFVTEKWCDANPQMGATNSAHNLFASLENTKLATHHCLHFDEYFHAHGENMDDFLVQTCQADRPDAIFFTFLYGAPFNPEIETLRRLNRLGIPLLFFWFDMISQSLQRISEMLAPHVTLNVCFDVMPSETKHPKKFMTMWVPQDESLFFDPHEIRDMDVSFAGSRSGVYTDRRECLDYLKQMKVNLVETGGQREAKLSPREYAAVYQRSKISINFSRTGPCHQPKGRIYEVMLCGSLLLESANNEIKRYYEPGVHYIPFENPRHCHELIQYYLAHDEERTRIAFNGWKKTTECYNALNFWKKVLEDICENEP